MPRPTSLHPAVPPEPRQTDGCIGPIAYAVLFIAGMTILYAFFLDPFRNAIAARNWIETPCWITVSRVEEVTDKEKNKDRGRATVVGYVPEIKYDYRIAGQRHRSERIWFIRPNPDTQADARKMVERYPVGTQQQCYVNPSDPDFAVLQRGFRPKLLIGLIPLALALIGAIGLAARVSRNIFRPEPRFRPIHHYSQGAAITHRGKRGVAALLVVIFICVVWNLVVSFLLREVIHNWRDFSCFTIFLTLFAIPFFLVGLFLLLLIPVLFLKLFNPRPILTLTPAEAPLGTSVQLTWKFSGRYDRIHRLRISLEGREEATYGSGEDSRTAREVFTTMAIIDSTDRSEIRAGKAQIDVPANAVPTFVAPHNKIGWAIHVCGEIRRWPDVDEEFEFIVLPAPQVALQPIGAAAP